MHNDEGEEIKQLTDFGSQAKTIEERAYFYLMVESLKKRLDDSEKRILELRLEGYSYFEIPRGFKIRNVYRSIRSFKAKAREFFAKNAENMI